MKFSHVLLFCGINSGRPSSHGALFNTELSFPNVKLPDISPFKMPDIDNIISGVKTAARSALAKIEEMAAEADRKDRKFRESCVPHNTPQAADWKRQCVTADECCSKRITKTAKTTEGNWLFVCGCIPFGEPSHGHADNCCSGTLDASDTGKCGCISPDKGPQGHLQKRTLKLVEKDCCYQPVGLLKDTSAAADVGKFEFQAADFMNCGPRRCSKPGTARNTTVAGFNFLGLGWLKTVTGEQRETDTSQPPCCGRAGTLTADSGEVLCKCIPTGTALHPRIETVTEDMCCSGKAITETLDDDGKPKKRRCQCIPGSQELPQNGGKESDCCTGYAVDGKYCQDEGCVLPHETKKTDGAVCCTSPTGSEPDLEKNTTEGKNGYCGCLKGGTKVSSQRASWCCSRKVGSDGRCTWLSFKLKITIDYMTDDECFSGKTDDDNTCLCMKPDDARRGILRPEHAKECCSNSLNMDGSRCSCINAEGLLRAGSDSKDCCTEATQKNNPNVCKCGPIGQPYAAKKSLGMKTSDCCSRVVADGFCACIKHGDVARSDDKKDCCGHHNMTDDNRCGCRREGEIVPRGKLAKDVCCSRSSEEIKVGNCADKKCS